jgi:hypothetical protein
MCALSLSLYLLIGTENTIMKAIKQVMKVYESRGHGIEDVEFNLETNPVHMLLADNDFQFYKRKLKTGN